MAISPISLKERPVLNSMYIPSKTIPSLRSFDLHTLLYWIKRTPECIGIGKRIATDVVTEISFTAIEPGKMGAGRPSKVYKPNVEDRAMEFSKRNLLKHKLLALVLDYVFTGDFYLWMGKIRDKQIKEIALQHYKDYGIEVKEIETKQFFDEDFNGINAIEIVPSSVVRIIHDEFKITKYLQETKVGKELYREFLPDEIIHGKFIEIDGSVYGFSPMEASYTAIRTVNAIQDYNWFYFENGAKIDRVWKFMGNPNEDYIKKFKEDIRQYVSVKKAHGHLVLTGADKIESESLNEISAEMEYRQLAIHSIGRIAHAFNMAADTLSPILGGDIKQAAGSTDIEDAGYNRNIERMQEYIENLMNTQLWIPFFKVEMKFERNFRQDKIRQSQDRAMITPFLEFLFRHDYPITDEFVHNTLQIPRKYLTKGKIKREVEEMGTPFSPGKPMAGPKKQAFQEQKKKQQAPQQSNNPPTGS